MKYVICGGLGFIGSEIVKTLLNRNKYPNTESVIIIDDDSKGYGTSKITEVLFDIRLEWHVLDLTTCSSNPYLVPLLRSKISEADHVINCAAKIGGIGYFNKIPATILRDNNLILSTILDAIMELPYKQRPHLTYMSSSMVFESATEFPSKESDVTNIVVPITAYGFSKLSGEYYCKAFAQQYGLRYTIVRPFNAVGPEKPDPNFVGYSHVLPDLVCKIKNGQGTEKNPLKILGNGEQVRHYTDVKEIAEGILVACHSPKGVNEDFNIAIEKGHTVKEVAQLVWNAMGPTASHSLHIQNVDGFKHDVMYRSPDINKTLNILGWKAKITLDNNIDEIVQSVLKLL